MINPRSRAHRILRHLRNYQKIAPDDSIKFHLPALTEGDSWIGLYRNDLSSAVNLVGFSERAVHIKLENEWKSVDYEAISDIKIDDVKERAMGLRLIYHDDQTFLPVMGGDSKLRDAFEVLRFLNRVRSDLRVDD